MARTKKAAAAEAVETEVVETTEAVVEAAKAESAPKKRGRKPKTEVKEEVVKEEAVKVEAAPKKTTKKVNASIMVEYNGQSVSTDAVLENVKKTFEAEGNKLSAIKDLQIYVKPEDNAAYYVINQDITGKINLF